ncbi:hypothetical protein N0V90_000771 [Kalmusia sp. IMI 367209]|nr:hypothetical protein N0V90_000771 [Kalmusia sp. IMI 367209]
MGHHHSKPGNCPNIFECPPEGFLGPEAHRSNAYEDHAFAVHVFTCLLLMTAVGTSFLAWRVRRIDRDVRKLKVIEGTRDAEKGLGRVVLGDHV